MNSLRIAIAILLCTLLLVNYAVADTSRDFARKAYYQIEGNVFDISEINSAIEKLKISSKENKSEPWVYITASRVQPVPRAY